LEYPLMGDSLNGPMTDRIEEPPEVPLSVVLEPNGFKVVVPANYRASRRAGMHAKEAGIRRGIAHRLRDVTVWPIPQGAAVIITQWQRNAKSDL
jgi:hypothetical protein